ncbi:dCTP deaminase [Bifidobacterium callimiconis]|uniref:dCTP deaminase, dUMP-forming n=1 Tax=Bifidobacterium callimiconis TaxID=2306973 RepID=A0A430FB95_9BIFI|nr:dCTP deaminase [Bifidobacterium callimiconis]RSX50103.1 deoxycytidine triphosphate deaminase [Bifidobacterium callimiconis]
MLLSDHDILAAQASGNISLTPWTPEMVQPASVDVRLDRFFRVFNSHKYTYVDPAENQGDLTEQFEVAPGEPWILHPGEFILGSTWEYVKLDSSIAARLEGKSSLGRLGILTHSTAGFIDPGFEGHITLELSNVSTLPVKLWPGMKIGQMCFFSLSSPADNPYGSGKLGSHYQGQRGPTPSRSYVNFYCADVNDGEGIDPSAQQA